jgi:DNA-directed RNA polymerase specialized sigma24 family protein
MEPGAAFEDWYRGCHARLVASLTLVTGDLDAAADAADEAMVRAYERWDRVAAMGSPDGWAFRVAINVLRRRGRRRAREERLLRRSAPVPAVPPEPAGPAWAAVRDLPLRQREVVVLRFVADLTEPQIAAALGISRGTVASTLSDARHRLAALLADPPADPLAAGTLVEDTP